MARRAVFNGFIAAGIVGDVAADHAAVGTGRVPGIEEAVFGSFTLQVPVMTPVWQTAYILSASNLRI